jgi:hypothetical protein
MPAAALARAAPAPLLSAARAAPPPARGPPLPASIPATPRSSGRGVGGRRFRRIEARDLEGSARAARERWKLERSNTFRRPATSPRSAGAFLAVTLVLAAVLWWLRRRRRRNQTAGEEGAGPLQRLSYRRIRPIFRGTLPVKGGGGQACGLGHRGVAQGGARMNVSR